MALAFFKRVLILVRGGGDLASGVVYRLHRAGFPVVVTELEAPLFVRRTVSYGEAVYSGESVVDGIVARLARDADEAQRMLEGGVVPVVIDPQGETIDVLKPAVVVDGRMAKINLSTTLDDAALVVALGPGFVAGVDCHAVIETNRGHRLGRVIYQGSAQPDTGVPGTIQNRARTRVLRAPAAGHVQPLAAIGEMLREEQPVARMGAEEIRAPFDGVLRGLIHERAFAGAGMKIGDVDPRGEREHCYTISDKSLAVGGGVLEAVLAAPQVRAVLTQSSYETSRSV